MTIGQIVGEGLALHRADLAQPSASSWCWTMLDEVGLSSARAWPTCCSAIRTSSRRPAPAHRDRARGRAAPEVLVLDEPTSALDVSVQQQVLRLLAELQRHYGMSYVFISHDLAVVRAMSHRVMVMKNGDVIEEGEALALFGAPRESYTKALLAAAHLA
jgi:microcin C transport system ATP-binding protein